MTIKRYNSSIKDSELFEDIDGPLVLSRDYDALRDTVKAEWAEAYEMAIQQRDVAIAKVKTLEWMLNKIADYDCPGGCEPRNCMGCAACDARAALAITGGLE